MSSLTARRAEVEFATVKDRPRFDAQGGVAVDLGSVHRAIDADPNMRHFPLSHFEESYDRGHAAVALSQDGSVSGHVRFLVRPGKADYERIGLPSEGIPEVFDIGSGMMLPEMRGQGHYPALRNHLLEAHLEGIMSGAELILGVTGHEQVLKALRHSEKIGVHFETMTVTEFHRSFAWATQLFCNCTPKGDAKVPFHLNGCTEPVEEVRFGEASNATSTAVAASTNGNGKGQVAKDGTMPFWTVYWSSTAHLLELEAALRDLVKDNGTGGAGSPKALHALLEERGFYE